MRSARDKLREHFLLNLGIVLDSNELKEVAGISEWARRIRELRNNEGYKILTHNDLANLKPGEYLLKDPRPEPVISSAISKELRAFILDRNGFTCQSCGIEAGEPHPDNGGRKARLHIAHIVDRSKGGAENRSNLRALCSVCNEGAQNLTSDAPSYITLLSQIRRAKMDDQRKILEFLKVKFE